MSLKKQQNSQRRQQRKQRRASAIVQASFCAIDAESSVLIAEQGSAEQQPRFDMTAYNGGRLFIKNFEHPVVVDLRGLQASRNQYPIHLDHDNHQRVGHTDELKVEGGKLLAAGPISFDNESANEVIAASKKGFVWQASVGLWADPQKHEFVPLGKTIKVNGRDFEGPLIVARKSRLNEISFVSNGGDEDGAIARIAAEAAANSSGADEMDFEQWLTEKGFDPATLSDAQKAALQLAYNAEVSAEGEDDPEKKPEPVAAEGEGDPEKKPEEKIPASGKSNLNAAGASNITATRKAHANEVERIRQIGVICAEYGNPIMKIQNKDVSIEAHAIQAGWSLDKTRLEALQASRGSAAVQTHSHQAVCTLEAMQAAAIVAAGVPLDFKGFGTIQAQAMGLPSWTARKVDDARRQQVMEAAHHFSQMSSIDICREAIRLDGRMVPSGRSAVIQAAFSGGSLLNIWSTNVGAQLLMKFQEAEDSTAGWVQEKDVPDFRLNERARVKKGGRLTKHARGKAADHHSGDDTKEMYRIARYSNQLFVDEMDIIDDRLMAIGDVIDEMALACARLRPDLVYAILLGNPDLADEIALFHASHSNLDDSSAAMDATHIKEALTRMALMREGNVNLNISATHLVTARTLLFPAQQLLNSAEVREPAATGGGTKNPLQGFVPNIVPDARIDNGVIDPDSGTTIAGDPTAFFLISADHPTIEVGYLQGTGRAPQVTNYKKQGEDGLWGVGAAVKMDIGAAAMAYQAMQKLTA